MDDKNRTIQFLHGGGFLYVYNAARSQMAKAFVNKWGSEFFVAGSVDIELGVLNPFAVNVMAEIGIIISSTKPKVSSTC